MNANKSKWLQHRWPTSHCLCGVTLYLPELLYLLEAVRSLPHPCVCTFGLFAVGDAATMYSSFHLTPGTADYIHHEHGVERNVASLSMALAIPMVTQVSTTPIYIQAMDYYQNRKATMNQRMEVFHTEFSTVSFAHGLRILPAFGIGSFSAH